VTSAAIFLPLLRIVLLSMSKLKKEIPDAKVMRETDGRPFDNRRDFKAIQDFEKRILK